MTVEGAQPVDDQEFGLMLQESKQYLDDLLQDLKEVYAGYSEVQRRRSTKDPFNMQKDSRDLHIITEESKESIASTVQEALPLESMYLKNVYENQHTESQAQKINQR